MVWLASFKDYGWVTIPPNHNRQFFLMVILAILAVALIFIGIAIGGLSNPILAMIALSTSILVSYLRARAESLGIELKGVGIGERAERLLILSICGFIPISESIQWGIIIIILISGFSFLQRFRYVLKRI